MKTRNHPSFAALLLALVSACSSGVDTSSHHDGTGGQDGSFSYPGRHQSAPIDLLFVIDNSASMADKQEILAAAVPDLVDRLIRPRCINSKHEVVAEQDGKCPALSRREFDPIQDIHIGVISSSIGGHGSDSCSNVPTASYTPRMEDMAHLLTRDSEGGTVPTYDGKGFLLWDPRAKGTPPGDSNAVEFVAEFVRIVRGAGQDGCGFEASLEAWYRFLVDPAPYGAIVATDCSTGKPEEGGQCRGPDGTIDDVVLQQRRDFLRPDSMLAVVMLTDENDCSVIDADQGFLALRAYSGDEPFHMPRATSACNDDPNSPDCKSCGQIDPATDPQCATGFSELEDALNLRCWRQKERFGIDFLYPVRRYVYGLTQPVFKPQPYCESSNDPRCTEWDHLAFPAGVTNGDLNPLFCTEYEKNGDGTDNRKRCKGMLRDPKLVLLVGIVGVPWQDIANNPNSLEDGYRPAEELSWTAAVYENYNHGKATENQKAPAPGVTDKLSVWNLVVGEMDMNRSVHDANGTPHFNSRFLQPDPRRSGMALDPLMIESVEPRAGVNPATGTAIAASSAGTPTANPINGHEWDIQQRNDLQYACVFELPAPKDCLADSVSCDCAEADGMNNPLCQNEQGQYGKTQYRGKAYPGRRQLATLRGVEALNWGQTIVASICPANTRDSDAADYGYRPAMDAIIDRLRTVLSGTCWSVMLAPDADGHVDCAILEATKYPAGESTCAPCDPDEARAEVPQASKDTLESNPNYVENALQCVCEILQAPVGAELDACISSTEDFPVVDGKKVNGWCYVDPAINPDANAALVAHCNADEKRAIRFVGWYGNPKPGSLTFMRCKGTTFGGS